MKKLISGKLYIMLECRTVVSLKTKTAFSIPAGEIVMYIETTQRKTRESNLTSFTIIYKSNMYSVNTGMPINEVFKDLE